MIGPGWIATSITDAKPGKPNGETSWLLRAGAREG